MDSKYWAPHNNSDQPKELVGRVTDMRMVEDTKFGSDEKVQRTGIEIEDDSGQKWFFIARHTALQTSLQEAHVGVGDKISVSQGDDKVQGKNFSYWPYSTHVIETRPGLDEATNLEDNQDPEVPF